jgi:hypothetical protein
MPRALPKLTSGIQESLYMTPRALIQTTRPSYVPGIIRDISVLTPVDPTHTHTHTHTPVKGRKTQINPHPSFPFQTHAYLE